jgi:hypothetical protein
VNPIYQRFESKHYNYLEDYNKFHRLDTDNGLKTKFAYMNGDLGKLKGGSHQRYILSDFGELEIKDEKHEYLHYLAASLAMLEYVVTEVSIPGDPTRRVGDVISILYPEYSAFDETKQEVNQYVAGNYLVVGIRHMFNPNGIGYTTIMQCMKNTFYSSPEEASKKFNKDTGPKNTEGTI